jgi:ankyrin repeat protein
MTRNYLLIGILALNVTTPVVAGIQCSISDWPLEMPHGTSDFIRVFAPGLTANTVVTHLHTSTRTVGSHPSPANAASTLAPRNWKDRRSPTPSQWQKLFYAVMDDDGAQVERLLGSTRVDLNVSPSSNGRGSLLNVAAALGEPEVARVLIAHGAHVRDQPGDSIQLHPIADAVGGLEGYLNTRDLPDPFFNRPPRSTERYLAAIHMLLDAGADPDALVVPSETLSPLGNLMFVPRFAGDVEIVRLLVAHGASVDGPPPIRSPLGIALDKGYDDYAAALLADHHVSAATLNHGLIMAIAREDVAMGQTLLGSGADANFKIGTVPVLCRALDSREMHSLALALLAHQADANVDCGDPRSRGGTPLTLVDPDDHELIDLLVARGGELGVPAVDGTLYRSQGVDPGPINWALLHHRDHVAFALLAREPSAAHECGTLVYAARYGATETLARLLALGGDPNSSSADGVSALMAAAFHGETGALKVLLAQPRIAIDRTTSSHFNPGHFRIQLEGSQPPLVYGSRTALMFAALGGSVDATSLLIAHGARLHKKDAEGLEAAEYAHNDAVAQLLAGGANATN